MGSTTEIPWTDSTWNVTSGCTKVSPGCDHCYGERLAEGRLKRHYPDGFGKVALHPERLEIPLHWKKPRMVFVCSMSDLFHPRVPFGFIEKVMKVMWRCDHHTFQLLTKRPGRMAHFARVWWPSATLSGTPWPPNVWAGVSVENATYLPRAKFLYKLKCMFPHITTFLSGEPLLDSLDLTPYLNWRDLDKVPLHARKHFMPCLDQVILGGESGPNARPMHPDWPRTVRDDCQEAGVPFFFKQWGEWAPRSPVSMPPGSRYQHVPVDGLPYVLGQTWRPLQTMYRVGRKAAGALLDGEEHRGMP